MALAKNHFMEETQIRDLLDGWAQAFQARDLDRLMSHYTEDVAVFDLMPPLRYEGKQAYRKLWEETLPAMGDDTPLELAEQRVAVDEEVAFCHGHFSNPIDMATGKGLMDLKP